MVGILKMIASNNTYIIANSTILIYYNIFKFAVVTNANLGNVGFVVLFDLIQCFIQVVTHYVTTDYFRTLAYSASDANY